jgi:hypothetical protein
MSKSDVFKWHKHVREGRDDVNDDEMQSAPITKRTDEKVIKVRELVQCDSWLTCRVTADFFSKSKETVRNILVQDLGMRKATAKIVL